MNFVEPIRDRKKISQIKNLLRGQKRFRDLLFFTVGINTALRVSDMLRLRIGDLMDEQQRLKAHFTVREQKTSKRHDVAVNTSIQEAVTEFLIAYPDITSNQSHFIFFNSGHNAFTESLKRGQAWKIITTLCKSVGLRGNFGTHSLRKTWGYHARMNGVDLSIIMYKLNHSNLVITRRYLGFTNDEVDAVVKRLNL